MWRIPRAGYPLRFTRRVIVEHLKGRAEWGIPPWKYYYEARNVTYYRLHLRRARGRLPRKLLMLTGRAVLRERDRRALRLVMIGGESSMALRVDSDAASTRYSRADCLVSQTEPSRRLLSTSGQGRSSVEAAPFTKPFSWVKLPVSWPTAGSASGMSQPLRTRRQTRPPNRPIDGNRRSISTTCRASAKSSN